MLHEFVGMTLNLPTPEEAAAAKLKCSQPVTTLILRNTPPATTAIND